MGNQFLHHTYLSKKFSSTWFYYSPWFSLFFNLAWSLKSCFNKIPSFLCHLTQFPLASSKWLPNYHAYIAIKFGCPTVHTGTTRVKRNILSWIPSINNISCKCSPKFNFRETITLTDKLMLYTLKHDYQKKRSPNWRLLLKFSHQYLFSLAMATEMVAAWCTGKESCV